MHDETPNGREDFDFETTRTCLRHMYESYGGAEGVEVVMDATYSLRREAPRIGCAIPGRVHSFDFGLLVWRARCEQQARPLTPQLYLVYTIRMIGTNLELHEE